MESVKSKIRKRLVADVVVVGGGTAGVFAAIASAKTGAKTLLIEKNSILGGTMTVANVNYPGLFYAWGKQIVSGPCWESIERTVELGGAVLPEFSFRPERHWHEQIKLDRFIYTSVLFQMCDEANVDVLCNSMLSDVTESDDGVELLITCKEGLCIVKVSSAIDATGDANLCMSAGFELAKSVVQQPATLQNTIYGYEFTPELAERIEKSFNPKDFPNLTSQKIISFLIEKRINLHTPCADADTSAGKTEVEKNALNDVMKVYCFLKNTEGLENIGIDLVASETGIRESNRIVGKHVITKDEYINGEHYPDSIAYAFYPVDLHVMEGIKQEFHKENVVAKVPYSALIPKKSKKILCAGRCISSDAYANSGLRVEAVCMATGQAAGCAAAIAAKKQINVSEVDYSEVCDALSKIGATVPRKGN